MKKKLIFGLLALLAITYFVIPETEIKRSSKESVAYLAEEMGYPPGVCNFLVNTKLGRKLCYIGLKKEVKNQLKNLKKEIKDVKKEL